MSSAALSSHTHSMRGRTAVASLLQNLLVLLLCCTCCVKAAQHVASPAAASLFQIHDDAMASKDSYAALSSRDRAHWSQHTARFDVARAVHDLLHMQITTSVEVRLVGFSGDGNGGISVSEHELMRYLTAAISSTQVFAIDDGDDDPDEAGVLAMRSTVKFYVTKAPRHIAESVESAINAALSHVSADNDDVGRFIAASTVSDILHRDSAGQTAGYTLYILNPKVSGPAYAYHYGEDHKGCPGTLFIAQDRHLWIDLSAGPMMYGPASKGEGLVLPHSIPRLRYYSASQIRRTFLSDLAGLAMSACRHLITPPISHVPLKQHDEVEVVVVIVQDAVTVHRNVGGIVDVLAIEKALRRVSLPHARVRADMSFVAFGSCELCVAAYSRAMKSRTGRVPGPGFQVMSHSFLDSHELHHWLSRFRDGILDDAGVRIPAADASRDGRLIVLPAFIYMLASDDYLGFDEEGSPVAAFPDMVLGVVTKATSAATDLMCNGTLVRRDTSSITGPVIAGLLDAGWGVAPPDRVWSEVNGLQLNHLWSVGQNPFSPLSQSYQMSFAQVDAAQRNPMLAMLNSSITDAVQLLRGFIAAAPRLPHVSTPVLAVPLSQRTTFVARTNVLLHKVRQTVDALGMLQHDVANYWLRSMQHDIRALQRIAAATNEQFAPAVVCADQMQLARLSFDIVALVAAGSVLGAFGVVVHRMLFATLHQKRA